MCLQFSYDMLSVAVINMPKRFTFVLPDAIAQDLEDWATDEGRATANLVSFLIEQAVRAKHPNKYPVIRRKE